MHEVAPSAVRIAVATDAMLSDLSISYTQTVISYNFKEIFCQISWLFTKNFLSLQLFHAERLRVGEFRSGID
jgi:hypothetical protein